LENYPNTPYILDAVNGIQYAYVAKEEPGEAVTFIDNFIASNPSSKFGDQIYFKKGDILYSSEKYSDAILAYKDFLSKFPSSNFVPNAYYWMGKSAANLKNVNDAVNNFNTVVDRWLKNDIGISAAIELANIYSESKNYVGVIQLMDKATAAVPTSNRLPELLFIKGTAEVKNNSLQNAYETFDQIIKYYDSSVFSAKAKIELGILEMNRNQFENAQLLFKELGEKRTDDIGAQAQYYYGLSLLNQNKITDAITAFVRVRSVFASFDEWYTKSLLKLGDCYLKLKDKKQARDMYRAVIERHKTGELAQEAKRKLNQL
jgi:TolA-binding protein